MYKRKIPWEQIRIEYATTGAPLRDLATKYGLSENTVMSRARRCKWSRDKAVVTDIRKETVERLVEETIKPLVDKGEQIADLAVDKVLKALAAVDYSDTKRLKEVTSMIKDLKDVGFLGEKMAEGINITFDAESIAGLGGQDICK